MKSSELAAVSPRVRTARRRREELDFLPAALEILETPASPVGRAIGGVIILFFILALAWSVIGRVEIIASASGRIVPSGRTKVIQPLEIGVVRAIPVHDGQSVTAGQVLVELDPTAGKAERTRLADELVIARLDIARLTAILSDAPDPAAQVVVPQGATPARLALGRALAASQVSEYRAKLAGLDRLAAKHAANRAAVAATVDKLSALLPILRERAEMRRTLYNRQIGSKLTYLGEQQQLIESERELTVQKSRLIEAEAALQETTEQRHQAEAENRRLRLAELAQAQAKSDDLAQDLVKAEQRTKLLTLTAPVDGVVQQLAIHTVGGVVTPAQALMAVVPADSQLEIEATVPNHDVGFVHAGQTASIKIDSFDFTRYGLLHGTVLSLSLDTVGGGPGQDQAAGRATDDPRPLAYTARLSLDRVSMATEEGSVALRPGMAVTVEINTGTRRVIDYLLSPLTRYRQDSLRER
ncbi:MAG TPA: HlyD family type I secretion periplasmic adaptor subunit [Reyranella sp.]